MVVVRKCCSALRTPCSSTRTSRRTFLGTRKYACTSATRLEAQGISFGTVDEANVVGADVCELVETEGDILIVCNDDMANSVSMVDVATNMPPISAEMLQKQDEEMELTVQSVLATITFVFGIILVEFGIQDMLDHFLGDSVLGAVGCIVFGLAVVFGIKLSGFEYSKIWQI